MQITPVNLPVSNIKVQNNTQQAIVNVLTHIANKHIAPNFNSLPTQQNYALIASYVKKLYNLHITVAQCKKHIDAINVLNNYALPIDDIICSAVYSVAKWELERNNLI